MKTFAFVFLLFLLLCFGITVGIVETASRDLPDIDSLSRFQPYLSSQLFDRNNQLVGKVFTQDRVPLRWKDCPQNLKNAIIATEDSRFYQHFGIDLRGILRSLFSDLLHRQIREGGSTITQQLARNLYLTPERTLSRKIKEALLALEIEQRFSKDEILLLYLNQVYFGAGAYGAEAAAETYFGKDAKDLDLAECAFLAGLPQAPSLYSPFNDPQKAKARQQEVLHRMREQEYITKTEEKQAESRPLSYAHPKPMFQNLAYPYFTTYVLAKLLDQYPANLVYKGGLKVFTTLDTKFQEIAEKAVQQGIHLGKKKRMHVSEGALVAVDPKTGFIKAMVGGDGFSETNQFNRAWQAHRQPGSAFKIFVYSCALDNGFKPTTTVYDSPISFPAGNGKIWSPHNDDLEFWGAMPLRKALAYSRNVVAIRVASQIGIEKIIEYAHRMGIEEPLDPYLPTAIGASVVTPVEMAAAACTLANQGIRINPTPIRYIEDRNGNVVQDNRHPEEIPALSPPIARTMTDMLQDVIRFGTGTRAKIGRPAAGKTGTASDFRDSWFVGYTPDLAAVVWTGNDDYSKMNHAYGGYIPAMTWANFMKQALKGIPPHPFTPLISPVEKKSAGKKTKNSTAPYVPPNEDNSNPEGPTENQSTTPSNPGENPVPVPPNPGVNPKIMPPVYPPDFGPHETPIQPVQPFPVNPATRKPEKP